MSTLDENQIKMINKLMKMIRKHGIDEVSIGDITIKKSLHPSTEPVIDIPEPEDENDEDLLYYSVE